MRHCTRGLNLQTRIQIPLSSVPKVCNYHIRRNVFWHVVTPVPHLNPLIDPTRGPRDPRGPQENPSTHACTHTHTQAPQAEWKTSHHHLNRFPFSFQLSNLLLSAISLSVVSCHPAHSSLLAPPPSAFLSFLVPSFPSHSLFFINFWLSSSQRSQRRSVKR